MKKQSLVNKNTFNLKAVQEGLKTVQSSARLLKTLPRSYQGKNLEKTFILNRLTVNKIGFGKNTIVIILMKYKKIQTSTFC